MLRVTFLKCQIIQKVVDGLYWKFIDEKRSKLKNNPRLGIMTKMIDNMNPERKNKIFNEAKNFLSNTTEI